MSHVLIPLAFDVFGLVDASLTGYVEASIHFTITADDYSDGNLVVRMAVGERDGDDLVQWAGVLAQNVGDQMEARGDSHEGDGGFGTVRGDIDSSNGAVSWLRFRLTRDYVQGMVQYEDAWVSDYDANGSTYDFADPPIGFVSDTMLIGITSGTGRAVLEINSIDITPTLLTAGDPLGPVGHGYGN